MTNQIINKINDTIKECKEAFDKDPNSYQNLQMAIISLVTGKECVLTENGVKEREETNE